MKILQIHNFHYIKGGAATAYFSHIKILKEHGHQVACFSTIQNQNEKSEWSKYFVNYYDLNKKHNLLTKFKIIGRILYNLESKRKIKQLINDFKPEIAHIHNIYHHISPSIISELKKQKIPIVMTLHDYKLICPNYSLFAHGKIWEKSKGEKYYKCFFDKCVKNSYLKSLVSVIEAYFHKFTKVYEKIDLFISPSNFLKNKFHEHGFKGKIVTIRNPILKIPEIDNKIETENYLLYFGRLSKEKSIEDIIYAFARLKNKHGHKLLIVGDGPEKNALQTIANKANLRDKIIFTGYKKGVELEKIIRKSRVVILSSKWYDNYPYSILEAKLLTKILICGNIGGISEMIKNNQDGLLFNPGDINDLSKKMEDVIINYNKYKQMGIQARNNVININNKEKYYIDIMNVYKNL